MVYDENGIVTGIKIKNQKCALKLIYLRNILRNTHINAI